MAGRVTAGSILIYGNSKVGKTLDACNACRNAVVLLAEPDGLASVETHLGFTPRHIDLDDLDNPIAQVTAVVNQLTTAKKAGKTDCTTLILDTGTELANRILSAWLRKGMHNQAAYGKLNLEFPHLMRTLLESGFWTVLICHERSPSMEDGRFYEGGPAFPGKMLYKTVCTQFSTLLHARITPEGRRIYDCTPSPDWMTGCRRGSCLPEQDLDLRPIIWRQLKPGEPQPEWSPKQIVSY